MKKRILSLFIALALCTGMLTISIPKANAANNINAADIVSIAKSLAGKYPYVSGGSSPSSGFDCTGLIYYIYHTRLGYNMTLEQARSKNKLLAMGTKITNKSDLLPGDIIQYTISHVAIYVGNNRVLHAATSGYGVCYSTLENPGWNRVMSYAIRLPGITQGSVIETPPPQPPAYVTITFDPNGGTVSPTTQTIAKGGDPRNLPVPVRDGYVFCGWTLDRLDPGFNGAAAVLTENSAYGFERDTTVYAHWEPKRQLTPHTHVKGSLLYCETTHPHLNYYSCSICGEKYTDGSTTPSPNSCSTCAMVNLGQSAIEAAIEAAKNPKPETSHTHSGFFQYVESAHPHRDYYACTICGETYTDGKENYVDTCTTCNPIKGHWEQVGWTSAAPSLFTITRNLERRSVEVSPGRTEYRYVGYVTADGRHECWCETYLKSKFGSAIMRYSDWSETRYSENGKGWSCGYCNGNHIGVGHYGNDGRAWWPEYTLPDGKSYYWMETRTTEAEYRTEYKYEKWVID